MKRSGPKNEELRVLSGEAETVVWKTREQMAKRLQVSFWTIDYGAVRQKSRSETRKEKDAK